jgi:SAM-dependent methyltransferase
MSTPTIDDVKKFWNKRPCNIRHSNKDVGTREYFDEVEQKKYFVEPHILNFANFDAYKGKRVLEVGCGIGTAAVGFCRAGAIYTGIDVSDESCNIARQRLEVYGLKGTIICDDIENVVLNECFDLVYSFGVLHHTPSISRAIASIEKLLVKGGEFKMMVYAKNSWKSFMIENGFDQFEAQSNVPIANTYTYDDIRTLLSNFSIKDMHQDHIFKYKVPEYREHSYIEEDWFAAMPLQIKQVLDKNIGWHLCVTAIFNE